MSELKPLRKEAIPAALERAMRYRLLNESRAAESICLDILEVEPDNQDALIALLLSLTDQFGEGHPVSKSRIQEVLDQFDDEYKRYYYSGIVCERRARAQLTHPSPGSAFDAYDWLQEAMDFYEQVEKIRPPDNDEAILRWNTCVRIIQRDKLKPRPKDDFQPMLE